MHILVYAVCFILSAAPAHAAFLVTAIAGLFTSVGVGSVFGSAVAGFLVRSAISYGLSMLARSLKKKDARPSGLQTDTTTSGGTTPQRFILGRYATGGQLIAPPNSYDAGGTPRAWLVYAVALSVVPGCTLQRVVIDDDYVDFIASGDASWPAVASGTLADHVFLDFEDGSQTIAHPGLMAALAGDPDRPWQADMIGPGTAYATLRFLFNRALFSGMPSVRFEVLGIPLYDPRHDSTVGGSGAQRWHDRTTWAQTENPVVMIYNILRGIDVGAGMIWGGDCGADDLPLSNWFAAMSACDVAVTLAAGGTEPAYRAGIEVALNDEPAAIIDELLKACSGQITEVGGIWKIRVGAPAVPAYFLTDDDVIATRDQEFTPFPGLTDTYNGITATYPEPESLWESKEAPPRHNATWEAEDGGRRLVADLQLPACPHGTQVQRLMTAMIADHRRFRRHQIVLPPEAAILEPLETIAWTSPRHGYAAKVFEITAVTDGLMNMLQGLALRERDGADFAWVPGDHIPTSLAPTGTTPPAAQAVPGFGVSGISLLDGAGAPRRPGLLLTWTPAGAVDARGLKWQVRINGAGTISLAGQHPSFVDGELRIADGILPATTYQVRAQLVVDRATTWTAWATVTTPSVLLGASDIDMIGADAIADQAVSRQFVGVKTGGATTISVTTEVAATEIIAGFAVALVPAKGDNPVVVTLSGKCAAVTAPACLNVVLEFEYTAGSGVWASVGAGQPFHVISASTGVNAHHFTYAFTITHADLHLFQRLRLRCWVSSASPFNSRTVSIESLIALIQQTNR